MYIRYGAVNDHPHWLVPCTTVHNFCASTWLLFQTRSLHNFCASIWLQFQTRSLFTISVLVPGYCFRPGHYSQFLC